MYKMVLAMIGFIMISAQGFAAAMNKFVTMDSATHKQFKVGAIKHLADRCELSATKAKYLNLYLFPNP